MQTKKIVTVMLILIILLNAVAPNFVYAATTSTDASKNTSEKIKQERHNRYTKSRCI